MILRPAGRFLTSPFPPGPLAARFFAAVILPPLLFFAIVSLFCCYDLLSVVVGTPCFAGWPASMGCNPTAESESGQVKILTVDTSVNGPVLTLTAVSCGTLSVRNPASLVVPPSSKTGCWGAPTCRRLCKRFSLLTLDTVHGRIQPMFTKVLTG
jgi:hypothetical protein